MDELGQVCNKNCSINVFGFDHVLFPSMSDPNLVNELDPNQINLPPFSGTWSEDENSRNAVLNYISHMLMEDDDNDGSEGENRPGLFSDSLALQQAEKSLYDALGAKYPPSPMYVPNSSDGDFTRTYSSHGVRGSSSVGYLVDSNSIDDRNGFESSLVQCSVADNHNLDYGMQSNLITFGSSGVFCGTVDSLVDSFQVLDPSKEHQANSQYRGGEGIETLIIPNEVHESYSLDVTEMTPRGKKNHYQEDGDYLEATRSNKQLASIDEDSDESSEMYDKVLLCPDLNPRLHEESSACTLDEASCNGTAGKLQKSGRSKRSSRGKPRGKKQSYKREVVDLMTLLTQCAQAVARVDSRTANELLKEIRRHSSPQGDGTERMSHYLANALEARLAGTGRALDVSFMSKRSSAAEALAAYVAYLTASPYKKMSNFFANKLIWKLAEKATKLHIIDFGITYGFQWPGLFQHLSMTPGGPPMVRLTGVDFPQPGFRPAERVEETGRRLVHYCERFNVPFEYNGVAKKWETIRLEDLKIRRDEVLIVNCLSQLRLVSDEIVGMNNSPRDAVLNLIRRTNPDLFIHGIFNGSYNAPFFITRFQETLYQAYSGFDMFDAILPREDRGRMLYERDIIGRGAMSVIACEGTERVIRPETYKQWQIRNMRAGLRQLPLDQEIVEDVKAKVKLGYHKDFVVDEDSNWMLQGWKGRILSAISCWKPAQ